MYISDCCSTELEGTFLEQEICPSCREHCTKERVEEEPDYDGESDFGNSWENGGREQAAYWQSIK